ncbi:MBL fold metallo-hydrolase [Desulfotomaculum copahuensis]|uniref:MBL fold metallo-hydrolase n=1 Tax=Desulfotomaculum copahuensis TaxID=1838280 RepID=A0A1B7LG96_9FIRM|nr:MBL fold metallo-hydrolase [Desulfotomaculum copahuensis]OAT84992.1 MBL fold metallo-hydrolase [Desulfotomaculum copahuensis]
MQEIEKYGICQVRLPLPFRLNHVNCYAIKGRAGWWLVDSGLNDEPTRRTWLDFMREYQIRGRDIKGIYLTHYHPDHYGAAGWLQQLSGAPVYISATDAGAADLYWRHGEETFKAVYSLFTENGMPAELTEAVVESALRLLSRVRPHPEEISTLAAGEVQLGDYIYQVLATPGHSDGHLCFYQQDNHILFSGDHLLPQITSNISLWPFADPNPLKNFLQSLAENHRLPDCLVLPAHGNSFTGVQQRVSQLEAHHRERLELMRRVASPGATAYDVCRQVFKEELSLHEIRFAMAETLAHLVFLVERGELKKRYGGGVNIYFG